MNIKKILKNNRQYFIGIPVLIVLFPLILLNSPPNFSPDLKDVKVDFDKYLDMKKKAKQYPWKQDKCMGLIVESITDCNVKFFSWQKLSGRSLEALCVANVGKEIKKIAIYGTYLLPEKRKKNNNHAVIIEVIRCKDFTFNNDF